MEFIIFFIDWTCKTVGQRHLRGFIMYTYLIILARHYAEFLNKIDLLVGCGKILYIFIR